MRRNKEWKELRIMVAAALYGAGPWPVAFLREQMERQGWKPEMIEPVAKSLGVEAYEAGGETHWRLPANILPFVPRNCYDIVFPLDAQQGGAA